MEISYNGMVAAKAQLSFLLEPCCHLSSLTRLLVAVARATTSTTAACPADVAIVLLQLPSDASVLKP